MRQRIRLKTWGGHSTFEYEGSLDSGITLYYGREYANSLPISGKKLRQGLSAFAGREVPIGTSRTNAPESSLGRWLQDNVTNTAIASYIGPLVIELGYAERGTRPDSIRIRKL